MMRLYTICQLHVFTTSLIEQMELETRASSILEKEVLILRVYFGESDDEKWLREAWLMAAHHRFVILIKLGPQQQKPEAAWSFVFGALIAGRHLSNTKERRRHAVWHWIN